MILMFTHTCQNLCLPLFLILTVPTLLFSSLHLEKKVALPAVVIPAVALYDGGGGGHHVRGGAGHARHVQLGELVWK